MQSNSTHLVDDDATFMQQAIEQALLGRFTTTPNPNVGALIVNNHQVLARGFHKIAGGPHAERVALNELSVQETQGATCYVTLEPCSHFGRTSPCADALIKSGVARVVVGMQDPNPLVSGQGIERLRAAGIDVTVMDDTEKVQSINRGFIKRMMTGLPWVSVKVASSLDGRTAMQSGESKWITGALAREDVQILRAQSCAVLTGIQTVLDDDPGLNVRTKQLPENLVTLGAGSRQPLRVVLDTQARLSESAQILQTCTEQAPVLWVTGGEGDHSHIEGRPGLHCLTLPAAPKGVQLRPLLEHLAKAFSVNHLMVEAGATLIGSLLEGQWVDEWIHYQAPLLIGAGGRPLAACHFEHLSDCIKLVLQEQQRLGQDLKSTYRLEYP